MDMWQPSRYAIQQAALADIKYKAKLKRVRARMESIAQERKNKEKS